MRLAAAFLLVTLTAAFHAPLVEAPCDAGMDCCVGGAEGMVCCPLPASCSLRDCGADEREALLATMGAFLLPESAAVMGPAPSSLAAAMQDCSPVSRALRIPDPPPRG
jgi:hypothetical protein